MSIPKLKECRSFFLAAAAAVVVAVVAATAVVAAGAVVPPKIMMMAVKLNAWRMIPSGVNKRKRSSCCDFGGERLSSEAMAARGGHRRSHQSQPNMGLSTRSSSSSARRHPSSSVGQSSSSMTKKNEVWSAITISSSSSSNVASRTRLACRRIANDEAFVVVVEEKKRKRVTFAASPDEWVSPSIGSEDDDDVDDANVATSWYLAEDCRRFMRDAVGRSETINRAMAYAARNESTFHRGTGLTSPRVLGEYLSSPEEVIGVERMMTGQRADRENLRMRHKLAFVEEISRQRREGRYDPDMLAERLRNESSISAHMARERATYIILID